MRFGYKRLRARTNLELLVLRQAVQIRGQIGCCSRCRQEKERPNHWDVEKEELRKSVAEDCDLAHTNA
jgi:hypothetical protein